MAEGGKAMLEQARWDVRGALLAVSVAGVAAACWVVALRQMSGMDMGPGADLGSFSFFAPTWATMMAAMMLPSVLPAVLSFDGVERAGTAALFWGRRSCLRRAISRFG